MDTSLRSVDFPPNWIPLQKRTEHEIKMLEVNGKCEILVDLLLFLKNDAKDFFKLMNTLELQLKTKNVLHKGPRFSYYDKNSNNLEYKSNKGHARVFGFFSEDDNSTLIITNAYWKTTSKKKKQTNAFEKAERLQKLYVNNIK